MMSTKWPVFFALLLAGQSFEEGACPIDAPSVFFENVFSDFTLDDDFFGPPHDSTTTNPGTTSRYAIKNTPTTTTVMTDNKLSESHSDATTTSPGGIPKVLTTTRMQRQGTTIATTPSRGQNVLPSPSISVSITSTQDSLDGSTLVSRTKDIATSTVNAISAEATPTELADGNPSPTVNGAQTEIFASMKSTILTTTVAVQLPKSTTADKTTKQDQEHQKTVIPTTTISISKTTDATSNAPIQRATTADGKTTASNEQQSTDLQSSSSFPTPSSTTQGSLASAQVPSGKDSLTSATTELPRDEKTTEPIQGKATPTVHQEPTTAIPTTTTPTVEVTTTTLLPRTTTTASPSSTTSPETSTTAKASSKSTAAVTEEITATDKNTDSAAEKTTSRIADQESTTLPKTSGGKTEGTVNGTTATASGSTGRPHGTTTRDPECESACPLGWSHVENRCFLLMTSPEHPRYSFNDAQCQTMGGELVSARELLTPKIRDALLGYGIRSFNSSLVFGNAYNNRFLREKDELRVFDLSAPIMPEDGDIFGRTSFVIKRKNQTLDTSILSICMKSVFCRAPVCPVFELISANGEKLRTQHLDSREYASVGTKVNLSCFEQNSEQMNWTFRCGSKGQWVPHPSYSKCDRTWGKSRTVEAHGTYQPTMNSVHDCFIPGTEQALRFSNGSYKCLCKKGFEGFRCELFPLTCEQFSIGSDPCNPHGKCENFFEGFKCKCHNESRTGDRCQFDRLKQSSSWFWDSKSASLYSLAAISCAPSAFSVLLKHLVDFYLPFKGERLNDRQAVFANARHVAKAARCIFAGLFGHPQTFPVDAQNSFGAQVWLMFHFSSIAVLILHLVETHIGLDVLGGKHWNTLYDRNGKQAWTAVWCYMLAPFAALGAWVFYMIRDNRPSIYTFISPWSNLGQISSLSYFNDTQMIIGFGVIIVLLVTMYGYGDNYERTNPHGLHRTKAVFAYYRAGRTEPFEKVLRCRWLNVASTHFAFAHWILLMFSYDQPQNFNYQVMCLIAGFGYAILNFVQMSVVSKPEAWRLLLVRLMMIMPKKFSPTRDPISCWSREEILNKLMPEKLAKEKADEIKENDEKNMTEFDSLMKRRADWMAEWPDCPAHLVPHVPEEQILLKISRDQPWRFPSTVKNYVCEFKRQEILLDMAKGYMKDRLANRHNIAASAWRGCSKYIHRRHDYNAPDSEDIQIWCLYKETERMASHNDTLSMGRDMQDMRSREDWDHKYYSDMEYMLKKLPHHDPRPKFFRQFWELMEKSIDAWRLVYSCDNPPVVGYPERTFMGTRNVPLHPPLPIVTKEMYDEKILEWKFMTENNNRRWDPIYSTDSFIQRMELKDRLQFERLQPVIQVTVESGLNPRDGELKHESDLWWDHRRPGFIGPRNRKTRPTLYLWQLSHEREFMEEMAQNEFRRKNEEVRQMTIRRGTEHESIIQTAREFFDSHWPRKRAEPIPWRPDVPITDTPY